ncbi:MAG: ATP-binding protein [Myxococcota bacterium]
MAAPPHKLETHVQTVLATMSELLELEDIFELGRRLAKGFADLGAVMSWILLRDDTRLRALARWPEEQTDALFATVKLGALMDFSLPLQAREHPYVRVMAAGEARYIQGAEAIAAHLAAVFDVPRDVLPAIQRSLHGKSSVVLPLMAGTQPMGVAALNYGDDLGEAQRQAFAIFARSAATLLRFKREVIGRERLVRELEAALEGERRTRDELARAERLAALGEMAAVVAHEIRNPLAVMQNSLTALRRHVDDAPEAALLQRILDEEVDRVGRIIDDMLTFAAPTDADRENVDVAELLTRAVFAAEQQCGPTESVVIERKIATPMPAIPGDAHNLVQAIVNLIVNAHQATREQGGGRVVVEAGTTANEGPPRVRVRIRDEGAGMDPRTLAHVWEPFFTTRAEGTGLGLAIVKRIVEAHRGTIVIDSQPREGTTVTVELPSFPPR